MSLAQELISAAKENGADIAKFQFFDAKTLFKREGNPWYEYNLKTELSFEQVAELARYCEGVGIEFMASAFDIARVKYLNSLHVQRHKIASRSIRDIGLAREMLKSRKPIIASLGHWDQETFPSWLQSPKVSFLFCISNYPTRLEELNFSKVNFQSYAGFSDHTLGLEASFVAISRGARIIEKHFTLDKTFVGPDHAGSMTPLELKALAEFARKVDLCL